jgi:hypothetical protein
VEGEVTWTRSPLVSVSIIATSPGVIESFSSISSCGTTSTRIGRSWMRCVVRVAVTTTFSERTDSGSSSTVTIVCAAPFTVAVTRLDVNPNRSTPMSTGPSGSVSSTSPLALVSAAASPIRTTACSIGPSSLTTRTSSVPVD